MMLTAYLFYSFFGYLSGSVLYSYLIPKYFCHVDVRTVNEDQNPGAFNAFSVAGPRIGLLCVLCDIGKGFLPVFLAAHSFDGFLDFRPDSACPGGRTRMAVSAACERRKGDLCLVWRAARPPAGSAAGASSGGVLSDVFADSHYPATQSALDRFVLRVCRRRTNFPISSVRAARQSADITRGLPPPSFQPEGA